MVKPDDTKGEFGTKSNNQKDGIIVGQPESDQVGHRESRSGISNRNNLLGKKGDNEKCEGEKIKSEPKVKGFNPAHQNRQDNQQKFEPPKLKVDDNIEKASNETDKQNYENISNQSVDSNKNIILIGDLDDEFEDEPMSTDNQTNEHDAEPMQVEISEQDSTSGNVEEKADNDNILSNLLTHDEKRNYDVRNDESLKSEEFEPVVAVETKLCELWHYLLDYGFFFDKCRAFKNFFGTLEDILEGQSNEMNDYIERLRNELQDIQSGSHRMSSYDFTNSLEREPCYSSNEDPSLRLTTNKKSHFVVGGTRTCEYRLMSSSCIKYVSGHTIADIQIYKSEKSSYIAALSNTFSNKKMNHISVICEDDHLEHWLNNAKKLSRTKLTMSEWVTRSNKHFNMVVWGVNKQYLTILVAHDEGGFITVTIKTNYNPGNFDTTYNDNSPKITEVENIDDTSRNVKNTGPTVNNRKNEAFQKLLEWREYHKDATGKTEDSSSQEMQGSPTRMKRDVKKSRTNRGRKYSKKFKRARLRKRFVKKFERKKRYATQSVHAGTIVYQYTDLPERDNLMFPDTPGGYHSSSRYEEQPGELRQVQSDVPGRVSDDARDPPGQQSVYIPPGDNRHENYRLSTYEHFSVTCPVSRKYLAKAGFYFTGFFDRVKCFACGRTVERWEETDNPADLKWHKPDCPFPRGEDCGNVPVRSLFGGINYPRPSTSGSSRSSQQVLQQTDPNTGERRTVRFPADLPERVRQQGGTFQIGPNNSVHIQSGPSSTRGRLPGTQQAPMPPTEWRMANVISSDHRRFLTNLFLNRELDRVASYARWPVGRPNVSPAALARSGFFYLGDMDRTQCFSCGGVLRNWTLDDDAQAEHRSHFPACPMVLGTEQRNIRVPDVPDTPDERARNFPCRFPSNPHMRNAMAREDTFDRRWPAGRTAATPQEISQAGFFFLGERDRVKCWYCNGGLQHWEYDDMPWIEHAKWFPTCQFLLQVKGQHFVYRHLSMNPHLARPIIAKQDGSPLDGSRQQQRSHDIPPSGSRVRQPSPPPTIIDPQEEMRKRKEKVEKVIRESDVVKNVLTMGFSERIVRILLEEKMEAETESNSQEIYDSVTSLLDDVMKKEEELRREEQEEQNRRMNAATQGAASMNYPSIYSTATTPMSSIGTSPGTGLHHVSNFDDNEDERMDEELYSGATGSEETPAKHVEGPEETISLQEQLNKIEEERMCKICFSNPADMVFVPCGHMCCCMECTKAISQCPMCRIKIQRAIKTYLS